MQFQNCPLDIWTYWRSRRTRWTR